MNRILRFIKHTLSYIWYWLYANGVLIYGIWRMSRLPAPRVTFFGSARFGADNQFYKAAGELALKCAAAHISIITGGGSGIMEAGACSITNTQQVLGIALEGLELFEERPHCIRERIVLPVLSARKWLLMHYSQAFVIFPGGIGTLDEVSELLTLLYLKKMPHVPVIFFGSDYWKLIFDWIDTVAIPAGAISAEQRALFVVSDSVDECFNLLHQSCYKKTAAGKDIES